MNVKIVQLPLDMQMTGLKQERIGMEENKHIQWIESEQQWVVWDEAEMAVGFYDTYGEAETAFKYYCLESFDNEDT